jgi:hypothetical protein
MRELEARHERESKKNEFVRYIEKREILKIYKKYVVENTENN